ncbi:TlpA disulfide reductase family protein [Flavobacterium sp.]|uniref:TlpA disulfide reductase family protein n=1 Tax=Flavobacterium sp. TaxID=239 RepID=UPI002FDA2B69
MKLLYLLFFGLITIGTTAQNVAVYDTYAAAEKAIVQDDSTIYVINFWATWCAPCVKELPSFEKLHLENKSVKVILVSLDSKKDLEKKLLPFLKRKNITAEVVLLDDKDYNTWLPKVDKTWSGSIPATWMVQGKRKLFAEHDFESFAELNDYVNSFTNLNK